MKFKHLREIVRHLDELKLRITELACNDFHDDRTLQAMVICEEIDWIKNTITTAAHKDHPVEDRYTKEEYADLVKPPDQFVE